MKKEIKFSKLDVESMISYLEDADIDVPTVIDFMEDKVSCRAHPQSKTVVKSTTVDTSNLMVFDDLPKDFKAVRFPLHRIKKLTSTLGVFKSAGVDTISGVFTYDMDGDNMYVLHADFKGGGIKIRVKRTEVYLVPYMEENIWDRLSTVDNYTLRLDITKEFANKLIKLIGLKIGEDSDNEKNKSKSESFIMEVKDNKVCFKSKANNQWSVDYREEDGNSDIKMSDTVFVVPKVVLAKMNGEINTVYMTNKGGQWVMVTKRDEENVMLNGVQELNE